MNRILMITTGGTLACTPSPRGLVPTLKGADILKYATEKADIDIYDYELIDSSIMTDREREGIAQIIWDNRERYDSFIITHGTDSLAYTAAYLDCALKDLGKSIILIGAQYPLTRRVTDAVGNLDLAIRTAREGYWGVALAIFNRIIPARSATKMDTVGYQAFDSVTNEYLNAPLPLPEGTPHMRKARRRTGLIYITPNIDPAIIRRHDGFDRVLVLVLGAGGMPRAAEEALDWLKSKQVDVYIKSQCILGDVEAIYEAHSGVKKYTPVVGTSIDWAVYAIMFGVI